jgi:hypothetical protein
MRSSEGLSHLAETFLLFYSALALATRLRNAWHLDLWAWQLPVVRPISVLPNKGSPGLLFTWCQELKTREDDENLR